MELEGARRGETAVANREIMFQWEKRFELCGKEEGEFLRIKVIFLLLFKIFSVEEQNVVEKTK